MSTTLLDNPVKPVSLAEVAAVADTVGELGRRLDPESVPLPDATAVWEHLDRIERVARAAKVAMARRVDESREWQRRGYRTVGEFLSLKAGTTPGEASKDLDTSTKLRGLPGVAEAARQGELSGPQLGLVAGAAAVNPGAAGQLVEKAKRGTLRELRDAATRARAAADTDREATEARIHRRRHMRSWTDPDGTWRAAMAGTVADGAKIEAALKPVCDRIFNTNARAGNRHHRDAYQFDALLEMLQTAREANETAERADATDNAATDTTGHEADATDTAAASEDNHEWESANTTDTGATARGTTATADTADHGNTGGTHAADGDIADPEWGPTDTGDGNDPADEGEQPYIGTCAGGEPGHDAETVTAEHNQPGQPNTDPGTEAEPGRPNRADRRTAAKQQRRAKDPPIRYLAQIRIDIEALQRGWTKGDELCEIPGVGPIPVTRARQLLGESLLHIVITRGQDVATIAPAGRAWTAIQRLAATWHTTGCTVTGCTCPRIELDHRHEYANGGPTTLDNADALCRYHHDLKTHHGWALVEGTGKRDLVPPTDPRHPNNCGDVTQN